MDFGRVLGGFWEAKILYFPIFFDVFLKLKFERCFESKNLRKKRQTDAGVTHFGPARRNVRGAGERKREGFRSLLGQNSGKNILGKHFRCNEDRRSNLIEHPARSSPVGRRIASRMPPGHDWGKNAQGNDNHMDFVSSLLVFVTLLFPTIQNR